MTVFATLHNDAIEMGVEGGEAIQGRRISEPKISGARRNDRLFGTGMDSLTSTPEAWDQRRNLHSGKEHSVVR